ncbi:hypothetical protein D3869_14825 (plasmid) [Azospirillum brasilense]|uniref:Uncharacterized protein n=1 Tax=Azospirillum brasilense TaxID=192 RepID=A0A4D8R038_AZOBR|nr:hypothetical protein [Azospirillum brasilense]QCO16588.1 hypothetical protein D3869_14825 [Azospirillum brasilense]
MSDKLRHVVERFPDLEGVIKQHSADNRFFRSLCEDYGEAVEILRGWEASNGGRRSKRTGACRDLIADLEQEILLELQNRIDGV